MGPTEKLIEEFARRGQPLGLGVRWEEVPDLIMALRRRLGASAEELDVSPASLTRLELRLVELHQSLQGEGQSLAAEDLVRLVREVTAYVGHVLVTHADGQWVESPTLWTAEVSVEGPWEVIKDERYISPYPTSFIIGSTAAWAWDTIAGGGSPNLYRLYREARTKRLRERVSSGRGRAK